MVLVVVLAIPTQNDIIETKEKGLTPDKEFLLSTSWIVNLDTDNRIFLNNCRKHGYVYMNCRVRNQPMQGTMIIICKFWIAHNAMLAFIKTCEKHVWYKKIWKNVADVKVLSRFNPNVLKKSLEKDYIFKEISAWLPENATNPFSQPGLNSLSTWVFLRAW